MAKKVETKGDAPDMPETLPETKTDEAPAPPTCGTCANRRGGECHFLPPQVTSALFAGWPPVKQSDWTAADWCAQYEAAK